MFKRKGMSPGYFLDKMGLETELRIKSVLVTPLSSLSSAPTTVQGLLTTPHLHHVCTAGPQGS